MPAKYKSVDEYISSFEGEVGDRLGKLRNVIKKAAPKADEMISYNMPLYKLNGSMLISFAAWKDHIGMYPIPNVTGELKRKILPYTSAKSTLVFPHKDSLPVALIIQIVKLRVKENRTHK